jgi:hypothetical protein
MRGDRVWSFVHVLGELRQQAWSRGDTRTVRWATHLLNGHTHDIEHDRKSSYFKGDSGAWGNSRPCHFSADESIYGRVVDLDYREPDPSLEALIEQRDILNQHGRKKRVWLDWDSEDERLGGGAASTASSGVDVKWKELGGQRASELLGSQTNDKFGHVTTELAGGDHDRVWLVYFSLKPSHRLEEYQLVLCRRGRLPAHLKAVKADGERLILGLHQHDVASAQTARVFGVNERTVRRVLERNLNVRNLPYRGKEYDVTNIEVLERINRLESRLAESLNAIQWDVRLLLERHPDHPGLRDAAENWNFRS